MFVIVVVTTAVVVFSQRRRLASRYQTIECKLGGQSKGFALSSCQFSVVGTHQPLVLLRQLRPAAELSHLPFELALALAVLSKIGRAHV